MKKTLLPIVVFSLLTAWGGTVSTPDGRTFQLPVSAVPGGKVTAQIKSDQPICLRLNGTILGMFKPVRGIVTADLSPAVNYTSENQVTCCPAAVMLSVSFQDEAREPAIVRKLRQEKIRMNSSAAFSPERAKRLRQAGFNVIMGWSGIHADMNLEKMPITGPMVTAENMPKLKSLEQEIRTASAAGLIPLPLMWYHNETQKLMDRVPYDKCRSVGYGVQNTPCPLDEVYWDRLVKPTLKLIAGIYRKLDVPGGMTMDQEFYGCGYPGFTYGGAEDGCYCDACMTHFFQAVGEAFNPKMLGKTNRLEYILKKGYTIQDYLGVLQVRLTRKLRDITGEVRAIKPDFLMGLMPGMQNWYTRGIARGIAAPGLPVLILNEDEYYTGYNQRSQENLKLLRSWGFPAFYVAGMVISSYNAEGLGVKSVEAAQKADGYWLYYGEMLFKTGKVRMTTESISPTEYALRDQQTRYLDALTQSNAYLVSHPSAFRRPPVRAAFPTFPSQDFSLTRHSLTFSQPGMIPRNLLASPKGYAKPAVLSEEGGVVFNMSRQESNECSWEVTVQPGRPYRISMLARATDLSLPFSGVTVKENNRRIARKKFNSIGSSQWRELSCVVTPKTDKLTILVFAYGKTGFFEFKDVQLKPVFPFSLTSERFSDLNEALAMKLASGIYAELINPTTGMAYFRLIDGTNDLRLLQEIYGHLPQAVRVFGELTGNVTFQQ